jgi:hypothetical protein
MGAVACYECEVWTVREEIGKTLGVVCVCVCMCWFRDTISTGVSMVSNDSVIDKMGRCGSDHGLSVTLC